MFIENYGFRLIVLVAFFVVVAAIDYYRKREHSQKWKQYLIVLICAFFFAIFGAVHDQITVTISKDYYTIGKGISPSNLRMGVFSLGLKTGSYAGIIFSITLLYFGLVENIKSIVRYAIPVGIIAICCLILGTAVGYMLHRIGFRVLNQGNNAAFLSVWGWHIGLYLGGIIGLVYVVKRHKST